MRGILLVVILMVMMTSFRQTDELSGKLVKYRSEWGKACTQCKELNGTYRVYFKSTATQALDVKVAAQENDKRWRVFSRLAMQPNDSIVAYACKGTGKYMSWVKAAGDNSITFPTDEEINLQYGK
ncbi:MAG TPA: hypothetical protein PLG57_12610 [Bacteroidia bacterium]|jgi:hypothetical protein|nr:hypothetical protein [Bacteroidia bacterium]